MPNWFMHKIVHSLAAKYAVSFTVGKRSISRICILFYDIITKRCSAAQVYYNLVILRKKY